MREYEFFLYQPKEEIRGHYNKLKNLGETHITHAHADEEDYVQLDGKIISKQIDEAVSAYCSEVDTPTDKLRAFIEYSPADVDLITEFQATQLSGGSASNMLGSSNMSYQQEGNAIKGMQSLEDLARDLNEIRTILPEDSIKCQTFFTDGYVVLKY